VEHIIRQQTYPPSQNRHQRLKRLPLLRAVFLMWIIFTLANMGTRLLAQYTPLAPNPFPAYADIFPGHLASAVPARALPCLNAYDQVEPETQVCVLEPEGGLFSEVRLKLVESTIEEVTFVVRGNTLAVGELEA
jgi:hypothetical protein